MDYDIVIIGGGVAGLTAGLYSARSGATTLILENNFIGGTTATLDKIENYPGFTSISGMDLANNIYMQAINFGAEIQIANINNIDFNKKIIYSTIGEIKYKALIIATGSSYKKLGCMGEDEFHQRGVSYCAVCDGALYKNKKIVVVTNGLSAKSSIDYLKNITSEITVLDIGDKYSSDKFKLLSRVEIVSINGNDIVNSITINYNKTIKNIDCDGVFICLDKEYKIDNYLNELDIKEGFIVTNNELETNIPNVYCIGDIRYNSVKQIVCACADGAQASLNAVKKVKK